MLESAPTVVHVVAADAREEKLAVLETLLTGSPVCGESAAGGHAGVVHVGPGTLATPLPASVVHVRAPIGFSWLRTRALAELVSSAEPRPVVLHAWSPTALSWCLPLTAAGVPTAADDAPEPGRHLLAELSGAGEARELARRYRARPRAGRCAFVCPTALARRRLMERGVRAEDCVVIRESVDFAAINAARGKDVRARLDLEAPHTVILASPPVIAGSGTFGVAWAALLVAEVLPDVRLVVPGVGREADRLLRFAHAVRRRRLVRFTRRRLSLPELLAAADVVAYLPADDAPVTGLAWAMAAAKPIVATAVPAVAELLAHGHNAWLCRPDSPRDAARRMLQALQRRQVSARQAEMARSQAFEVFGRQRMAEQYARVCANLANGRPVGERIRDSAIGV